MEVASDRGEGGNGTLESLQPETAREHTSGTRGRPLPVYCQFRRKLLAKILKKIFAEILAPLQNAIYICY